MAKCGKNNDALCPRTLSYCGLWPNVAQNVPLIGGLCPAADLDQMWPKMCPLSEDFVTQRTLIKCGPKCAPHWMTLSCSRLQPNVAQYVPLIGGLCHAVDFGQMWPKNVPLVGGLCHAADFDQMWPKMCPLLEDFVTQETLTKCGPKCAPCWRTLSHSGLQPNVVQVSAIQWVTSFCYGVQPHMDRQRTHHQKRLVPRKQILIIDQCRTKTAKFYYNAMWSIHKKYLCQ